MKTFRETPQKRSIPAASVLLFLLLTGGLSAGAAEPAPGITPSLTGPVNELLSLLQSEKLAQPDDPAFRHKVLQSLVSVIDCGARYETTAPATGNPSSPAGVAPAAMCAPVILRKTMLYLPMHEFTPDTGEALKKVLASMDAKKKWGLILDLRTLSGGNLIEVRTTAAAVTGQNELPLVLLTGGDTIGGGELLTLLLKQYGGVVIGQPTRGCFSSLERHALSNGDRVWLPHPTQTLDGIAVPSGPLLPDVTVQDPPAPGWLEDLTPERYEAMPDRDPALRQAVELLTMVLALGEKRF